MYKFAINTGIDEAQPYTIRQVEADWYRVEGDYLTFYRDQSNGEDAKPVLAIRAAHVYLIECS